MFSSPFSSPSLDNLSCSEASGNSYKEDEINPWYPYHGQIEFETARLFYKEAQLSAQQINKILILWHATLADHGLCSLFKDHHDLYNTINATLVGGVPWESFIIDYKGPRPSNPSSQPQWMDDEYNVYFKDPRVLVQDMISNPDFVSEFNYTPYHKYFDGVHHFQNMMSGNWAWRQVVRPFQNCCASTYISII